MSTAERSPTPRNSSLREHVAKLEPFVARLSETLPWLRPNHLTASGTLAVTGISLLTGYLEKQGELDWKASHKLVLAMLLANSTDALDGMLARHIQANNPEAHDAKTGQLIDTLADRVQEAISAWLAMYRAALTNDNFWLATATTTALTNPLSSLLRAKVESSGNVVPESGTGALQFLGTRVGRSGVALIHNLPTIPAEATSVQGLVDALQTTANINTVIARAQVAFSGHSDEVNTVTLDQEAIENAKVRFKNLAALYLLTTTLTGVLLFILRNKQSERR